MHKWVYAFGDGKADGGATMQNLLGCKTKPDLKLGICGEHGGDQASIGFCSTRFLVN